jgi:hypothetical protein
MAKSPPERFTTAGELARAASAAAEQAGPPPTESSLLLRPDSHVPVDRDAPTAG